MHNDYIVLIVLVYYRITYYNLYDRYIGVNVAKNDILRESKRNMSFNFLNECLIWNIKHDIKNMWNFLWFFLLVLTRKRKNEDKQDKHT